MRPAGGRPAAVLIVLAVAAPLGACGKSTRDHVREFIQAANAVQRDSAPEVQAANEAYSRFSQGKLDHRAAIADLQRAEDAIDTTRDRLAALKAPAPAQTLKRRLLAVFDANARLAHEATTMARYLPGAAAQAVRVTRAGRRLQAGLRRAGTSTDQARALGAYARRLDAAEAAIRRLVPPPVLVPTHRAQLLRLAATRALARRLRSALARGDARAVAKLPVQFRSTSRATKGEAKVARAAARAYQDRYRAVSSAIGAMQREQNRVERALE
jgi:hypothetical protein